MTEKESDLMLRLIRMLLRADAITEYEIKYESFSMDGGPIDATVIAKIKLQDYGHIRAAV